MRFDDRSYPGVDLALVAGHQRGNMVLHDADESVLVCDGGYPGWELRVPNLKSLVLIIQGHEIEFQEPTESVTTDQFPIRLGKVDLGFVREGQTIIFRGKFWVHTR